MTCHVGAHPFCLCAILCLLFNIHTHACYEHHRTVRDAEDLPRKSLPSEQWYLRKLISKYGLKGVITFEGFEHLLESLGLGHVHIADHILSDHFTKETFEQLHDSQHKHNVDRTIAEHDHRESDGHGDHSEQHDHFETDTHRHDHSERHIHDHDSSHELIESDNTDHDGQGHTDSPLHRSSRKSHDHSDDLILLTTQRRHHQGGVENNRTHLTIPHDHESHENTKDNTTTNNLNIGQIESSRSSNNPLVHSHNGEDSAEVVTSPTNISSLLHNATTGDVTALPNMKLPQKRKRKQRVRHRPRPRRSIRKVFRDVEKAFDGVRSLTKRIRRMASANHTDAGGGQQETNSSLVDVKQSLEIPQQNQSTPCLGSRDIFTIAGLDVSSNLTQTSFIKICPILMYQLDQRACASHHHALDDHEHDSREQGSPKSYHQGDHDDHDHHGDDLHDNGDSSNTTSAHFWDVSPTVWGYGLVSVFIISAVGLLSVAIVPLMHGHVVLYNHLLQFMVALAIGSLTGDALLHLLPHALSVNDDPHGHSSHAHDKDGIWKGLTAFAGIYLFFLSERLVGILSSWKRKRQQKKNKLYPSKRRRSTEVKESEIGAKLCRHNDRIVSCDLEEFMMVVHPSKEVTKIADDAHKEFHKDCDPEVKDNLLGVHSDSNGHSHHHHHGDRVPGSVAAVAWMVIVGDGFHNFSDGLAIGAAFANSLSGGLSTSVAVFCHELPHELGDFAVLLRAGMSVKQALIYNCVSSVLCLFGLVVGIAVGNLSMASLWIFALIAGMFLYIALVDMLPEMTAVDPQHGESPFCHLLLQNCGILLGAAIMLVIAIFEDDIKLPVF